jgi:taurine dioxygenase
MKITKLQPFGVEMAEVNLATDVTDAFVSEAERLLRSEGAVLLRHQNLDDGGQIALARRFGKFSQFNPEDRASPVYRINNREGFGKEQTVVFHADNMFTDFPLKYLMLYGLDVTTDGVPLQGGETALVNVAHAAERLEQVLCAELAMLSCRTITRDRGSSVRPSFQNHPVTGRRYLVISQLTHELVGVDSERSERLLRSVQDVLYDEAFVYRHHWREGDLLMWDNHLVQHGRGHYDNKQNRVLRRTAIADDDEPTAIAV